jgi:hypothetical protein
MQRHTTSHLDVTTNHGASVSMDRKPIGVFNVSFPSLDVRRKRRQLKQRTKVAVADGCVWERKSEFVTRFTKERLCYKRTI